MKSRKPSKLRLHAPSIDDVESSYADIVVVDIALAKAYTDPRKRRQGIWIKSQTAKQPQNLNFFESILATYRVMENQKKRAPIALILEAPLSAKFERGPAVKDSEFFTFTRTLKSIGDPIRRSFQATTPGSIPTPEKAWNSRIASNPMIGAMLYLKQLYCLSNMLEHPIDLHLFEAYHTEKIKKKAKTKSIDSHEAREIGRAFELAVSSNNLFYRAYAGERITETESTLSIIEMFSIDRNPNASGLNPPLIVSPQRIRSYSKNALT